MTRKKKSLPGWGIVDLRSGGLYFSRTWKKKLEAAAELKFTLLPYGPDHEWSKRLALRYYDGEKVTDDEAEGSADDLSGSGPDGENEAVE